MTCVETRAPRAQEMEGISTPLSAAPCAPRKMVFSSYARAKAQYCGFLAPSAPKPQRNADAMIQRAPGSTDTKDNVAQVQCNATQRNARHLRSVGQVRWGPAESRRSFHQLVDRFPFGVDGSLQFPGLPHCLVAIRGLSVVVAVATTLQGVFQTYRADCNSMTSICA